MAAQNVKLDHKSHFGLAPYDGFFVLKQIDSGLNSTVSMIVKTRK